jgi:hypothetical protein
MTRFEKLKKTAVLFFLVSKQRMPIPLDVKQNFKISFLSQTETNRLLSCYFFLHFPPKALVVSMQILFYTMATPLIKQKVK